jgi:hypothetical protein
MPKEYLPIDEKTWNETGSKFMSKAGNYLAVFQMPRWKHQNKSYEFPFVIEQEGDDKGKMDSGFASLTQFALMPYFKAAGIQPAFENGRLAFEKTDFINKKFIAVYTDQPDTRNAAEGGTGKTFVKLFTVLPIEGESGNLV